MSDPTQYDEDLENFDDADLGDDESYTEDENWESFDEGDVGEDAPPPRAKKKSGMFNIIVIGVAMVIAAGVVVVTMGGGAPAPTPVNAIPAVAPSPSVAEVDAAAVPPPAQDAPPITAAAQEPLLTGTDQPPATAPIEATDTNMPPMPTAMASPETPALTDTLPAVPAPVVESASGGNASGGNDGALRMPSAQDVMLKPTPVETPAPAADLAASVTLDQSVVPNQSVAPDQSVALAALADRLDLVIARLDKMDGDVAAVKNQPPAPLGADLDAMKDTIAQLEKTVSALSKDRVRSAPVRPADVEDDPAAPPKPQILGPSDGDAGGNDVIAPAPKAAKAVATKTNWVLKGAQPGRAMLAKPGESDIQTVSVGDTLSGLGKITSIAYTDGRWVVRGTQGQISQ